MHVHCANNSGIILQKHQSQERHIQTLFLLLFQAAQVSSHPFLLIYMKQGCTNLFVSISSSQCRLLTTIWSCQAVFLARLFYPCLLPKGKEWLTDPKDTQLVLYLNGSYAKDTDLKMECSREFHSIPTSLQLIYNLFQGIAFQGCSAISRINLLVV